MVETVVGDEVVIEPYVWADHEGTCFRLFPRLIAKLGMYATFRRRDAGLVQALRTRAQEWFKEQAIDVEVAEGSIGPSVALAFTPSTGESTGRELLAQAKRGNAPGVDKWWESPI
jgi:hypothetical protein